MGETAQGQTTAWHTLTAAEAASRQQVDPGVGLDDDEVSARLAQFGHNSLAEPSPRSLWLAFFDQFKSGLILVLIGAAILAGAIGDLKDAVVILVVVLFNALLGFWQEHRAEETLAALKKMLSPEARIRRGGQEREIPASQLVPGDLVLLEAGDRVPADGRLVATHNVEIDESALTGESQPVAKQAGAVHERDLPLAERTNMAYMNTVVTRGRAELLVTGTGMTTEMGRLSGMLVEAETGQTPLQRQLDTLGHRLALIACAVIAVIFALGMLRGEPLLQTILTSIALAVAAIPEGLPAVVTVTLAIGVHRMAQHRAIVRRLGAVETLGCTTVICSDKTGTLTMNQMTARSLVYRGQRFLVTGEGYDGTGDIMAGEDGKAVDFGRLLRPAIQANDSRICDGELIGDPTEGALLALAAKAGWDSEHLAGHSPRVAEIPFDSAHKFQATFHMEGDVCKLYVKGAPDVLLSRADRHLTADGEAVLDEAGCAYWDSENSHLAGKAMRVLALAEKTIPAGGCDPGGDLMAHVSDLTFVGLAGISDPPRPEAREAIALCRGAGIAVKMITGDHRITAMSTARELGITGEAIDGAELEALSPDELSRRIDKIGVFARVAPEHKVRIVQALKSAGQVVAMTGDGVNDAPALKNADIGVAMGVGGTEVAREAATMVLTDDNFATIVEAVREGRAIYENIVKFVRFQLSTNMGAIQTVLGASLLGWTTPFTAIQILWINIIMDGPPAMSLGVEPAREGVMDEPPRQGNTRILSGPRFLRLFVYGLTMAVGTLALFHYAQPRGETYALTLAFTTFVLFQFFNMFNARSEYGSALNRHFFRNRWMWVSLGAVVALQVLVVHWGQAQLIFHTTDLAMTDWGLAVLVASSVLVLDEGRKLATRLLATASK
ncbi:MAG: calcium-translocating P-type ATPase, PMCA-type [Halieaceae bacterium]|jgi:Ca2+-transporting ATPase|nr:calcium-translocating P-type ATPase, PMCA-type [Halieaceae bacterium]